MNVLARQGPILRALGGRDFRIYITGNSVSHVGTWVQRVAVGWLAWELTGSPTWLGIVAFADLFPTVVLAPLTGAVADRFNRLTLLKISQLLLFGQAALLSGLTFAGLVTIEILVALVMFHGIFNAFSQPPRLAILPSLVARQDLSAAIGINSTTFNLARFLGPMLAGGIILGWGIAPCFAVNAASYLALLVALHRLAIDAAPGPPAGRNMLADIVLGYGYAARHPGIGPLLFMLSVMALVARPYIELLPGFADVVFGRGADGLAMLTSATGLGAVIGGVWLAQRGPVTGLTASAIWHLLGLSLGLIAFAAMDNIWLAMPILVGVGYCMINVGVAEQTLIQNAVDPAMRGRVLGLYGMINLGCPAVGALIMGAISEYVGLQAPVAGGAALCLVLFVWARRRRKRLAESLEAEQPG